MAPAVCMSKKEQSLDQKNAAGVNFPVVLRYKAAMLNH